MFYVILLKTEFDKASFTEDMETVVVNSQLPKFPTVVRCCFRERDRAADFLQQRRDTEFRIVGHNIPTRTEGE